MSLDRSEAVAETAVASHGKLTDFSGPAFVLDEAGHVVDANTKGHTVSALLVTGNGQRLRELAAGVAYMEGPQAITLSLEGPAGTLYLEATVIPSGTHLLALCRDATLEKNLRTTLMESRSRYKDLVEASSDFYWETDAHGRFTFVTSGGVLGHETDDLLGFPARNLLADSSDGMADPFLYKLPQLEREVTLVRAEGTKAIVLLSSRPIVNEDGELRGVRGVCRDVTEDRQREAALNEVRRREHLLNFIASAIRDELEPEDMLQAAADAMIRAFSVAGGRVYRLETRVVEESDAVSDGETSACNADTHLIAQASAGQLDGIDASLAPLIKDLQDRMAEADPEQDPLSGELMQVEQDGWSFLLAPTAHRRVGNGGVVLWQPVSPPGQGPAAASIWGDDQRLLLRDVANQVAIAIEQLMNLERIVALSRTDGLTGLLNRRAFFEDELPRRIDRLKRDGSTGALFYVDMDNFKLVNDVHGHARGDEAILVLRDLMLEFSRAGDLIARLGGDEFALWLDAISIETASGRAADLITASERLVHYSGDPDKPLGLSIGVSMFDPARDTNVKAVIDRADAAMYMVKRDGKGGYFMSE